MDLIGTLIPEEQRRLWGSSRRTDADVPPMLRHIASSVACDAVVAVRDDERSMVAHATWLAGDEWMSGTAQLSDDAPSFSDAGADTASLVRYGAAAIGVPTSREWLANRAERVNVAVGVRCLPEPHPATESQHILASATEILASHDAAIAAARMDALQGERARIASEIHQGAVQEIATVTLQLQLLTQISEMDPLSTRTLLSEVCDTARNCAQSLRSALIDLTPPTTRDSALVPVLSQMIERFVDACGLQVDLEVTGTPRAVWPEAVSLVLSFVQEGLTNMNKHSGDGEGRVRLSFGLDQLTVTVTNESAGHAWNGALENTPLGHGLSIMRARARLLGGDIAIKAGSSGTELSLEVPD